MLKVNYDASDKPASASLQRVTDGALHEVARLPAPAVYALQVGADVWFTALAPGQTQTYDLWRLPGGQDRALKVRSGIVSSVLHEWQGRVVTDGAFTPGSARLDCGLYCVSDEKAGVVYALATTDQELQVRRLVVATGRLTTVAHGTIFDVTPRGDGTAEVLTAAGMQQVARP